MRAAAVLRNAAKPKPMSADHTQYHLAPTVGQRVYKLTNRFGLIFNLKYRADPIGFLEEVPRCRRRYVHHGLYHDLQCKAYTDSQ